MLELMRAKVQREHHRVEPVEGRLVEILGALAPGTSARERDPVKLLAHAAAAFAWGFHAP